MLSVLGHILAYGYYSRPIFVIGAGRSGTTALVRAMGEHPRIFTVERESPFIGHVGQLGYYLSPEQFAHYYQENQMLPSDDVIRRLARLTFESCRGSQFGLNDSLSRLRKGDLSLIRAKHWSAKTFPNQEEFLGLRRLFPRAKFLYILRNGMDMVQSRTRFSGFKAHGFLDHCRTWTMNVDKYTYINDYPDAALEIRQDELISNPEKIFNQIFGLLTLEHHCGPVDFITNTIVHPLGQETRENVNVRAVLLERRPSWSEWDELEKETFKKVCGENMQRTGYEVPF